MKTNWSLTCLLLPFGFTISTSAEGALCEIENGKSNITFDINKSGGKARSQLIMPELPVIGDPYKEIALNLFFSTGKTVFTLNGKRLQLLEPLERDESNLSHVAFQVICTIRNTNKKRTIPAVVRLSGGTADAQNVIGTSSKTTVSENFHAGVIGRKLKRTTVELNVSPGSKIADLMFAQRVYNVQVSEASSLNSPVATIMALHSEKVPVAYSIVTGDDLRQFAIGYESGVISVKRKLDREVLSVYQLVIKAETSGGLSSTATVNIIVTDVNDESPKFVGLPYEFKVTEGEANRTVGSVYAVDLDEGINGQVSYSLQTGVPFTINETTGEIITTLALDYETQKEHKLVVTAKDGAPDPLLGTATVTVLVTSQDLEDEDYVEVVETKEGTVTVTSKVSGRTIIAIILLVSFVVGLAEIICIFGARFKFKAFRERMRGMQSMAMHQRMEGQWYEEDQQTEEKDSEVSASYLWIKMLNTPPAGRGSQFLPLDSSSENDELPQEFVTYVTIETNSNQNNNST